MTIRKNTVFNIIFAGNCLLLFLLAAEKYIVVPAWLQVIGRMHPLILHFPVVLLLLNIAWESGIFRRHADKDWYDSIGDGLLLATAVTSTITAIMGLLLSREEGYEGNTVMLHKWGGILLPVVCMFWYGLRDSLRKKRLLYFSTSAATLVLLIFTGHQGATITHGDQFLTAPVSKDEQQQVIAFEDALVFEHLVKPVLEAKCINCHSSQKAKGDLIMESPAGLLKGGRNGILWDTTAKDYGLMLRRLHLPVEDRKHMPPKGKPQLTEEEIAILYHWVRSGSSTTKRLTELDPADSLRILAEMKFSTPSEPVFEFDPADEGTVASLNNHYRVISPLASGSPALEVNFFGAANFTPKQLSEILPVKEQVISMNLNKMPVNNKDLEVLAQFPNLQQLILSFTQISDSGLAFLKPLTRLRLLSLSGTQVTAKGVEKLSALPALQQLYCWNTGITLADIKSLQHRNKAWKIESGFDGDTIQIQLNAPIVENAAQVIKQGTPLLLKHYVRGAEIRYTLDGSEPDSIHSIKYDSGAEISSTTVVKSKAYKKGWITSPVTTRAFYLEGKRPDSFRLASAPDPAYKGNGAATLFDFDKGDLNFKTPKWIGYHGRNLEVSMDFNNPIELSSIWLTGLVDIGSHIMPPGEIQVWGGTGSKMTLLGKLIPKQPSKDTSAYQASYAIPIKPVMVKNMKVVVRPLAALPKWHPKKGDETWIFFDEMFIY